MVDDEDFVMTFLGWPTYCDDQTAFSDDFFWQPESGRWGSVIGELPMQQSDLAWSPVKKGHGPESKKNAPDIHDSYDYEARSVAYGRVILFGYPGISLCDLVRIGNMIQNMSIARGLLLTPRNRAAKRRKPNAFHWIDENWKTITPMFYDQVVSLVLKNSSSKPRKLK
jgi:hypothetical protein